MFDNPPNATKVFSIWLASFYAFARNHGWDGGPLVDSFNNPVDTWGELKDFFMSGAGPDWVWWTINENKGICLD
jgi:hypothetical protein